MHFRLRASAALPNLFAEFHYCLYGVRSVRHCSRRLPCPALHSRLQPTIRNTHGQHFLQPAGFSAQLQTGLHSRADSFAGDRFGAPAGHRCTTYVDVAALTRHVTWSCSTFASSRRIHSGTVEIVRVSNDYQRHRTAYPFSPCGLSSRWISANACPGLQYPFY